MRDFYEVLGVPRDADQKTIKKAYRKLAVEHHPDKGGSEDLFKEVATAYETLSDEKKKAHYDRFGHAENPMGGNNPFNMDDIFSAFGHAFGGGGRRGGQKPVRRGEDIQIAVELTLEEYFQGLEKDITIDRKVSCAACDGYGGELAACGGCGGSGLVTEKFGPHMISTTCHQCGGAGKKVKTPCVTCDGLSYKMETITIPLKVPRTIPLDRFAAYQGKGHVGPDGAGNLRVLISVIPHEKFEFGQDTVAMRFSIPYYKMILGGQVDVDTIDGTKVRVTIPENTNDGRQLRLKNKGLYKFQSEERGDMILRLEIELPKELAEDERKLLEEIKNLHE